MLEILIHSNVRGDMWILDRNEKSGVSTLVTDKAPLGGDRERTRNIAT